MAQSFGRQVTFSAWLSQDIMDCEDKLVKLSHIIDWEGVYDRLVPYYSTRGRRGLSIRLMVGLHILKHMEDMSDAQCVARLKGDLYWMYFCGVEVEQLQGKYKYLDRSSMSRFRSRIGDIGFREVEDIVRQYLLDQKEIDTSEMSTDSSCMEKNIAYPTDSGLLDKGRRNLIKLVEKIKEVGIKGAEKMRSFSRRSKQILVDIAKLGKDRSDRIQAGTLELASQAVHVLNKSEELLANAEQFSRKMDLDLMKALGLEGLIQGLRSQMDLVWRVVQQSRLRFQGIHIPDKIYSLHEPQVIVIRKGKSACPNEYGSKFNISIDKNGYIVSHESYSTNKSDAKLLKPAIASWERSTGKTPKQVNADRGYVQKKKDQRGKLKKVRLCIPNKGKKSHPDTKKSWFKRGQSLRASTEAVIGHLKQDHRVDCCRYTGFRGDKINLSLGAIAWNLNKYSRRAG
jgi:transposase, IS5 family